MSARTTLEFARGLEPRPALKVDHGDEAIDRLISEANAAKASPKPAFRPRLGAVLDDACDCCALLKKHAA